MKTILITNDPLLAADAQRAGVSRIMVDLESHGKKERQASRTTFISIHQKEDIAKVRAVLKTAELIVRINPWYEGSHDEIDYAITSGADIIMLPMITDMAQVQEFVNYVGARAMALPLVETAYSMDHIDAIAAMKGIDELYIGLNDLHLSLGMDFLFEPLAHGQVDSMAEKIKAHGKPFGFGGIAAIGGAGELPPERILGEHVRLGSTRVILSSRFVKDVKLDEPQGREERLVAALADLERHRHQLSARSASQQDADAKETSRRIVALVTSLRNRLSQ